MTLPSSPGPSTRLRTSYPSSACFCCAASRALISLNALSCSPPSGRTVWPFNVKVAGCAPVCVGVSTLRRARDGHVNPQVMAAELQHPSISRPTAFPESPRSTRARPNLIRLPAARLGALRSSSCWSALTIFMTFWKPVRLSAAATRASAASCCVGGQVAELETVALGGAALHRDAGWQIGPDSSRGAC